MENGNGRSTVAHVPLAAIAPPLRCFEHDRSDRHVICGDAAYWRRPGSHWFDDQYFCDVHREPFDVPIVGECVVRRVRVMVDVLLSGASMTAPFAQTEALRRLERAVAAAGGLLDVKGIHSAVVRYGAPPVAASMGGPSDRAGA